MALDIWIFFSQIVPLLPTVLSIFGIYRNHDYKISSNDSTPITLDYQNQSVQDITKIEVSQEAEDEMYETHGQDFFITILVWSLIAIVLQQAVSGHYYLYTKHNLPLPPLIFNFIKIILCIVGLSVMVDTASKTERDVFISILSFSIATHLYCLLLICCVNNDVRKDMEMQPNCGPEFGNANADVFANANANSNDNSNDNDVHAMEPNAHANANADVNANANDNDANVMEPNAHAVISDEHQGDNATENDEFIRNDSNLQLNNAEAISLNLDSPGDSPEAKGQEISEVNCDVFNAINSPISLLVSKKWLNKKRQFIMFERPTPLSHPPN